MTELWQGKAKRVGGPLFAEVLIEMRDTQRQMVLDMAALKARDQADEEGPATGRACQAFVRENGLVPRSKPCRF